MLSSGVRSRWALVGLALLVAVAAADDALNTPKPTIIPPIDLVETSTQLSHTTTPRPPVTSTQHSTTPQTTVTTPKPTVTTPQTTVTTPKPTVTTPQTTVTTPQSTVTSTPPTSTTVTTRAPPTPVPSPEKGKWGLSVANVTCIIIQMASQFNISYAGPGEIVYHKLYNIPVNSTNVTSGACGKEVQNVTLEWPSFKNLSKNSAFFSFKKNGTTSAYYYLTAMQFNITLDPLHFPEARDSFLLFHHTEKFEVPIHKSYSCAKKQVIQLETDSTLNSTLSLQYLQLEAFHTDKGTVFDSAEECDFVDVPDIVPIAVGCALGGLVLIVLIVYLVSRRHSQTRGYLSM